LNSEKIRGFASLPFDSFAVFHIELPVNRNRDADLGVDFI
jgi:hypothetical protein